MSTLRELEQELYKLEQKRNWDEMKWTIVSLLDSPERTDKEYLKQLKWEEDRWIEKMADEKDYR